MKNSALVVIDLQNDITKNYREIIENVNEAIDWAVRKDLWVVYIQHNNLSAGTRTFKSGTRGAELVPELNVVSDHIFTKTKSNALTSEAFAAFLQEHGISGLMRQLCPQDIRQRENRAALAFVIGEQLRQLPFIIACDAVRQHMDGIAVFSHIEAGGFDARCGVGSGKIKFGDTVFLDESRKGLAGQGAAL